MDIGLIAESIADRDVKMVFGIPGSGTSLSLIDAMEKCGVEFCLTHFEGSGVIMAATAGRLSGRAGWSLSIKGPGLANAIPGLAVAWFESMPVVHLAEAAAPDSPASEAHKRIDHGRLVGGVAKRLRRFTPGICGIAEWALEAESEVPGPVVVDLIENADEPPVMDVPREIGAGNCGIEDRLSTSERPIVIAGSLAIRRHWGSKLSELKIPVFSTAAAKGIVDEQSSYAVGVFTGAGGELSPEAQVLPEADLVIGLGVTAREVLTAKPFECPAISVEAVETPGIEGFAFTNRVGIDQVDTVFDVLDEKAWGEDLVGGSIARLRDSLLEGFLPGRVFEMVEKYFARRVRAVFDVGYFCTVGEHMWRASRHDWVMLSGQGRYMGAGIPMAIGASLYDPSVPTIAFVGDGGIGMYLAELKLAVKHRLPLLVVLMTDNAFGSIRSQAIANGLTQTPLIMDGRSWTGIIEAMGFPSKRAENDVDLRDALDAWYPESGPGFIEIAFDPDAYEAMVQGIR